MDSLNQTFLSYIIIRIHPFKSLHYVYECSIVCVLSFLLQIRAAFFKLMGTYLCKLNSDVSQPEKQLCQAVFSGLRETDPSAVVCAWQAMMVVMNKLEVCYQ